MAFIDCYRGDWGIEPICHVMQFAPSTYYAAKSRPPSRRSVDDASLKREIMRVYEENHSVYGVEKMWYELHREGLACGRDRVARLMRDLHLRGVTRAKSTRTTYPTKDPSQLPKDLVQRDFDALGPNLLWVADITYVPMTSAFAYTAFVIDAYARRIVGWAVSSSLRKELALDALEMAIWGRRGEDLEALVHHSDRGVQYLSIRYSARLDEAGIAPSVGSKGDSYDNALAETVNGLYKAELIRRRGPWSRVADVELATAAWVAWWNERRLHSAIGHVPQAEYEAAFYASQTREAAA